MALSGGGYRAAVTHAGLLAGLDAQCVPVHIVSSVSGGSIIGAAYALGVPPAEFAGRLARRKPGLVTAALRMRAVLLDLWCPGVNITEIYREHFQAAFYGATTLADLPETPLLLVNATDPEADILQAREVFFRGRAPAFSRSTGRGLDQHVRVADAVAASGAFPGAFRPKSIRWPASGRHDTRRHEREGSQVPRRRHHRQLRRRGVAPLPDHRGRGRPAAGPASRPHRVGRERLRQSHEHRCQRRTSPPCWSVAPATRTRRSIATSTPATRDMTTCSSRCARSRWPEQVGVVPYTQVDSRLRGGTPEHARQRRHPDDRRGHVCRCSRATQRAVARTAKTPA